MGKFAMGQPVPRTEDPRLLRGNGLYVDDYDLPKMSHAYVLRSPHAHAEINSIDVSRAKDAPGVLGVYTGADVAADGLGAHVPEVISYQRRDGSPIHLTPRPALCADRVRLVGDPVAFIVAETLNQAKDAAELIEVTYTPLPSVTDPAKAMEPDAPRIWPDANSNEIYIHRVGDFDRVKSAFESAHHVSKLRLRINRISPNTMETRSCIGDYDARQDRYVLYAGVQQPHGLKTALANNVFHVPGNAFRIISDDVGGSFGLKGGYGPEYILCPWAAKKIGRPVKWVAERSEGLATDEHDRHLVTDASIALDKNGMFLALSLENTISVGGYLGRGSIITPTFHLGGLAGTYLTPAIAVDVTVVFTNTSVTGPFRGSGRPEMSYILERLIDQAAREMGIDRAEIRRRNTVPPEAMPFKTGLIYTLDCGDFPKNLEDSLTRAEYASFEDRRAEAKGRGKLRGIGMSNIIEQTSQRRGETVVVHFDPTGVVTVQAGSLSHGQGHETMYKILISDKLGLDEEDIRVFEGDTDILPDGGGTYASRTAALGGTAAVMAADKVIEKAKRFAAHFMEAAEQDIEFEDGILRVAGTDKAMSLQDIARRSYNTPEIPDHLEPGLYDTATFAPDIPNFPNGCHVCEVEIDPETGDCDVLRYTVTDDVGTVINALTLEGQIHGGIGQAVGQVLTEQVVYDDETGQLLTGSFLDYGMPRADDMCMFDCENNPVPTKTNPIGAKGAGEAGNVGGLAAIMNAVLDALAPEGVTHLDMPATPEKIWQALQEAKAG